MNDNDMVSSPEEYMAKIESVGYSGALGVIKDGKVILTKWENPGAPNKKNCYLNDFLLVFYKKYLDFFMVVC